MRVGTSRRPLTNKRRLHVERLDSRLLLTSLPTITEFPLLQTQTLPQELTTGSDGNLWFCDYDGSEYTIDRITPTGVITSFPMPSDASVQSNLTLGPDGSLWCEIYVNASYEIMSINQLGVMTTFPLPPPNAPGNLISPTSDLFLGPDGDLWFLAGTFSQGELTASSELVGMTTAGVITTIPLADEPALNSTFAFGPGGTIWIAGSSITVVSTTTGETTASCALPNSGRADALTPGPDGNFWFIDLNNDAIGRITPDGTITEFPFATMAPSDGFLSDDSLIVGSDGNLWTDGFNGNPSAIVQITPNGVFTTFSPPSGDNTISSIAEGPDGNIWFVPSYETESDGVSSQIADITPNGAMSAFTLPTTSRPGFNYPNGFVSGPDGNLWFIDEGTNSIGRVNLSDMDAGVSSSNPVPVVLTSKTPPTNAAVRPVIRQPITPLTVETVKRLGLGFQETKLTIRFNVAIEAASANDLRNYAIVEVGPRGRARPRAEPIALKSATYDAATDTVTLVPKHHLKYSGYYRLTIDGSSPSGLTSLAGVQLAGERVGQSGTNAVIIIHR